MRTLSLGIVGLAIAAACAGTPEGGARMDAAAGPTERPVQLETATGEIHGTLRLPGGAAPFPVALIIAGSGPTDRNGNSPAIPGQNNSLRLLAEGLSEKGIATVRYDKRGIAESVMAGPEEADLRFDTYVEDAAAWADLLAADPRFSSVSIIGHSEGALVAIRAAQLADIRSVVSIAGTARPAGDLLREQLRPQLPPALWSESERILTELLAGRTVADVPAELNALYRPTVQPYMISWLRLDPAAEITEVNVPTLIVHGTTDIQVGVGDAHALHAAQPDAALAIFEGMNHILKSVPADPAQQQASYSNPALPVVPELVDRIGSFLLANR